MRIVTLLPSATEIVCELGLTDQLVGVTHECDYPPAVATLPKVTRSFLPDHATSYEIDQLVRERLQTARALYSLDQEMLARLRPDLLVTQALCDVCAVAESEVSAAACSLPGPPRVVNLEPSCLDEVFACIRLIADAAGVPDRADAVIARLNDRVQAVAARSACLDYRPRVVLLEWIDPPFSSGHWSPELVALAGGIEAVGRQGQRSRTVQWAEVAAADPEVLVIACCGMTIQRTLADLPILAAYPGFAELTCVRTERVYVVDGNAYFSRPGPRLVDSLEILAHALHPATHPLPPHLTPVLQLHPSDFAPVRTGQPLLE